MKRIIKELDEFIGATDVDTPNASITVRGRLSGVTLDQNIQIDDVTLTTIEDGIDLSVVVPNGTAQECLEAEQKILDACDALSLHHHLISPVQLDRSNFPSQRTHAFVATNTNAVSADVALINTSLNAHPELRSVLKVLQRADQSSLWIDRFILQWMAFNTIYNNPNQTETAQLQSFLTREAFTEAELQALIDPLIASNSFSNLSRSTLTLRNPRFANLVNDFNNALVHCRTSNTQYENFGTWLIFMIYALRNQFFHGAQAALPAIDEILVQEASRHLDWIIRAAIQKRIGLPARGSVSEFVQAITVRIGR